MSRERVAVSQHELRPGDILAGTGVAVVSVERVAPAGIEARSLVTTDAGPELYLTGRERVVVKRETVDAKMLAYLLAGARLAGCKVSTTIVAPPFTRVLTTPDGEELHWRTDDRDALDLLRRWQPDTESSASRQHYIDTGVYLPVGEVDDLACRACADDACLACGDDTSDGEGRDGLCGSCADAVAADA